MSLTADRIREIMSEMGAMNIGSEPKPSFEKTQPIQFQYQEQGQDGCFEKMEDAIAQAKIAQKQFSILPMKHRSEIIASMREAALLNIEKLSRLANEETGYGRVSDKIAKNLLAVKKTPGTEDIPTIAFSGDDGLTLVEGAPYGVIGAITPSTNPTSTVINNSISMVSAGNAVVYNPHPGAKKASNEAIAILNRAIFKACGINNLLATVNNPTLDSGKILMNHPDVRLLVVTGGEAVVHVAMKTGKKVIAAGPGNPPVIVDDTADIEKAASDIVKGASFDNNVLCIAEKEVFVFESVANRLISNMLTHDCYMASSSEVEKLLAVTLTATKDGGRAPARNCVGRSANVLLEMIGVKPDKDYRLIIAETPFEHPLVQTEMLMPILPVVRVANLQQAIDMAVKAENECHHTAMMHSKNVDNLTLAARSLDTTIFVKNAPSYAGLGLEGEGYTTLTIATPTGEGLTSAKNFVRSRRCALSGSFRII